MSLWGTANDFGKDIWLPLMEGANYQLAEDPGTLYHLLPKEEVKVEGRSFKMQVKKGDSTGGGTMAQGGDFPTPGDTSWATATVTLAREAHAIKLDLEEMDLLRGDQGSARDVVVEKIESAFSYVRRAIARQSHMDGTGVLATVASVSSTTITFDAVDTVQSNRDRFVWVDDGNRDHYDIVHATTGAQQVTDFTLSSISESANTAIASESVAGADSNGVLVRSGTWASGGAFTSPEFPGVLAAIDNDNTYLGINRSTAGNEYWQSTIVTGASAGTPEELTRLRIHTLRNKVARRSIMGQNPTGERGYCYIASPGVWTAAHELMSDGLRYTVNLKPDIGWQEFDLMGVPCYEDIYTPRNNLELIHKPTFKYVSAKHRRFGLMDWATTPDGQSWTWQNAASGAGHAGAYRRYISGLISLITNRPRNHGRIDDVTESAGVYAI